MVSNLVLIGEETEPINGSVGRKVQTTLTGRKTESKFKQEVDSWRSFVQSLRYEDRELFKQMMTKIYAYADAIEASGRGYTTEAVLISLLLSQHKTIIWLSKQLEKFEEEDDTSPPNSRSTES